MRERAEYDGRVRQVDVIGCVEGDRLATEAHALSPLLVRGREREREVRMPCDERAQLPTCITAAAEDSHRDRIHVIMHNHANGRGQWSLPVAGQEG